MNRLLELNALPVVNENDAVATDEVGVSTTIGENDSLSAIVARCVGADLLILLSDIDGLYTSDPREEPGRRPHPRGEGDHAGAESTGGSSRLRPGHRRDGNQIKGGGDRHGLRLRHGHRQRPAA